MVTWNFEEAQRMYEEGEGYYGIGKKLGIHPYSIQQALKIRGFSTEKRKGKQRGRKYDLDEVEALVNSGYTNKEIMEIVGIGPGALNGAKKIIKERSKK